MSYRNLDLWLAMILAVTGVAIQFGPMPEPIRLAYGLLLTLACPSYVLVAALFPGRSPGWPERLVTGIGLGLSIAVLIAAIFNWSPWGLVPTVWAIAFLGVTIAAAVIAMWRRSKNANEKPIATPLNGFRTDQLIMLGAAALITLSSVVLVRTPRPVTNVVGYTTLWIVPQQSANDNFVRLGISSNELDKTQYRLTVTLDGRLLHDLQNITLKPGETWERQLELPVDQLHKTVEAKLYRLSTPDLVYRHVTLLR